ncbi:hypothetical protein HKX48_004785 [Thoreauomyces humboldtii]|nr:hypothetical protein HKX48_004785 [Thoreauomyces humboldtii]
MIPQQQPSQHAAEEEVVVHAGITCDSCKLSPIPGPLRLKCGNCPNYDLCPACFLKRTPEQHTANHTFLALTRPLVAPVDPDNDQPILPRALSYALVKPRSTSARRIDLSTALGLSANDRRTLITIDNFLTPTDCSALVESAHQVGFTTPTNKFGQLQERSSVRNDTATHLSDPQVSAQIWNLLFPYLTIVTDDSSVMLGALYPAGLNTPVRFSKYAQGQRFAAHIDAPVRSNHQTGFGGLVSYESRLTLMVCLVAPASGGATRFLDADLMTHVDLEPVVGRAFLFSQDLLHAGLEVKEGVKIVLKADVMFAQGRVPDILYHEIGIGGFQGFRRWPAHLQLGQLPAGVQGFD